MDFWVVLKCILSCLENTFFSEEKRAPPYKWKYTYHLSMDMSLKKKERKKTTILQTKYNHRYDFNL